MRMKLLMGCALALVVSMPATGVRAQTGALPASASPQASRQAPLEKVTGIGGFFFRAADPKALSEWYERHLGVSRTPESYDQQPWHQDAGPTVLAPFPEDTRHFGAAEHQWMINFRVRDLDAMVAQLRRAGIPVEVDPQVHPNGRFARLKDPDDNPIELWEPSRTATHRAPEAARDLPEIIPAASAKQ